MRSLAALLALAIALSSCASASSARESALKEAAGSDKAPGAGADRKLVYNSWLRVEVKNDEAIPAALKSAGTLAQQLGGYVFAERTDGLQLKVPNEKLDQAFHGIEALGKVTDRRSRVDDVTAEYTDLAIRIENARRLQKRLQELLQRAEAVEQVLAVEKEMARVTEELERLEGRMRLMQNQTSFATLDVTFEPRVRPGPVGWVFYGLYHGVKWLFVWD